MRWYAEWTLLYPSTSRVPVKLNHNEHAYTKFHLNSLGKPLLRFFAIVKRSKALEFSQVQMLLLEKSVQSQKFQKGAGDYQFFLISKYKVFVMVNETFSIETF